jgi:hypothetical protein
MAWQSEDEVARNRKQDQLRQQLDEQMQVARRAVQARQELDAEFSASRIKAKHDIDTTHEKFLQSQADLAVANCELDHCKKQVSGPINCPIISVYQSH